MNFLDADIASIAWDYNDVEGFKVNGKYGIYVCAFGLFTASSYTADQGLKNKFGKLAYYFSGIKELKTTKKFPVTVKSENLQFTTDAILCFFEYFLLQNHIFLLVRINLKFEL